MSKHRAEIQEQRQQAIDISIHAEAEPQNAYGMPRANEEGAGDGLPVVTRLGDKGLTAMPVHVSDDGWRLFPDDPPFNPNAEIDDELARRIFQRQVRLSRKDIVLPLSEQPVSSGFESHPLLRNLKPLLLYDGKADFGKLRVRLAPELGITYETMEDQ